MFDQDRICGRCLEMFFSSDYVRTKKLVKRRRTCHIMTVCKLSIFVAVESFFYDLISCVACAFTAEHTKTKDMASGGLLFLVLCLCSDSGLHIPFGYL